MVRKKCKFIEDEAKASDMEVSGEEESDCEKKDFINDNSELSGDSINYHAVTRAMAKRRIESDNDADSSHADDELSSQEQTPYTQKQKSRKIMPSNCIPMHHFMSSTPKTSPIGTSFGEDEEILSEIEIFPEQLVQPYGGEMDDDKNPSSLPQAVVEKVTRHTYEAKALPLRFDDIFKNHLDKCKPKKIRKQRHVAVQLCDYLYIDMYREANLRGTMPDASNFDINLAKKKLRKEYPVWLTLVPGIYYCDKFKIITEMDNVQSVELFQLVKEVPQKQIPGSNFTRGEVNSLVKLATSKKFFKKKGKPSGPIVPFCMASTSEAAYGSAFKTRTEEKIKKMDNLSRSTKSVKSGTIVTSPNAYDDTPTTRNGENIKLLHNTAKQPKSRISLKVNKRKLDFSEEVIQVKKVNNDDDSIMFVCEVKGGGTERDEASSEASSSEGENSEANKTVTKNSSPVGITQDMNLVKEKTNPARFDEVVDREMKIMVEKAVRGGLIATPFQVKIHKLQNEMATDKSIDLVKTVQVDLRDNELNELQKSLSTQERKEICGMIPDDGEDDIFNQVDMESVNRAHSNLLGCEGEIYPAFVRVPFDKILKRFKGRSAEGDYKKQAVQIEEKANLDAFKNWFDSVQDDYENVGTCKLVLVQDKNGECPVSIINCDAKGFGAMYPNKWSLVAFQSWLAAAMKLFHKGTKMLIEILYEREEKKLAEQGGEILKQINEKQELLAHFKMVLNDGGMESCEEEIAALRAQLDEMDILNEIALKQKNDELEMIKFNQKKVPFIREGKFYYRDDFDLK